jgi:flagellar motility protein MotE (MotC chaperone)
MIRFRLLPVVIFVAAFALSLKLGTLWYGIDEIRVSTPVYAQEKKPEKAARKDVEKTGDKSKKGKKTTTKGRQEMPDLRFDPSMVTDSELDVLQKLAERRVELNRRSQRLDTRGRLLQATEKRIEAKLNDLAKVQNTISALLKTHDKEQEAKFRSIVKIYETMKPKAASRIFEQLDMTVLLDIIERMREVKASAIISKMSSEKAKSVTIALAERRSLPKLDQRK